MLIRASSGSGGGGGSLTDVYYLYYASATYYLKKNGTLVKSITAGTADTYTDDNLTFSKTSTSHQGTITTKKKCVGVVSQNGTCQEYAANEKVVDSANGLYQLCPIFVEYFS